VTPHRNNRDSRSPDFLCRTCPFRARKLMRSLAFTVNTPIMSAVRTSVFRRGFARLTHSSQPQRQLPPRVRDCNNKCTVHPAKAAMPLNSPVAFFLRCRLVSHSADAPTGGASCRGPNADTIHSVQSWPARFADSNDHLIRLLNGCDRHGLGQRRQCQSKGNGDQLGHFCSPSCCPSQRRI
jgi:hypothetical protein